MQNRNHALKLTTAIMKRFEVTPSGKSRALDELEAAGLIRVECRPRKNPLVTIVEVEDENVAA
jgi:DNA-binding MarR family transcriptional regulator